MVFGSVRIRQCRPNACFSIGYGLGEQFVDTLNQLTDSSPDLRPRPTEASPGMFESRKSEMDPVRCSPRGGFSFYPTRRTGVRIDVGIATGTPGSGALQSTGSTWSLDNDFRGSGFTRRT